MTFAIKKRINTELSIDGTAAFFKGQGASKSGQPYQRE